jgi:hypothetical protein
MRHPLLLTALLLFPGTGAAHGHGGLLRRSAASVEVRYAVPAPVVWIPVAQPLALPVFAAPVWMPTVVNVPLAVPSAAPPSETGALKPLTAYYDLYSGTTRPGVPLASGRCSVAFWNLTGRTITLRAGGQDRALPAGRSVTLELPHEFAWNVVGREAEAARIPASHTTAEILIRR